MCASTSSSSRPLVGAGGAGGQKKTGSKLGVRGGGEAGGNHGRATAVVCQTIDLRIPTMTGRGPSGFPRPGRQEGGGDEVSKALSDRFQLQRGARRKEPFEASQCDSSYLRAYHIGYNVPFRDMVYLISREHRKSKRGSAAFPKICMSYCCCCSMLRTPGMWSDDVCLFQLGSVGVSVLSACFVVPPRFLWGTLLETCPSLHKYEIILQWHALHLMRLGITGGNMKVASTT